ncbi:MAG: tetratricopeptide repeat protein [Bacteroidales bacterium]
MSEKNEPIFENEEFLILLQKYEKMRSSEHSTFFDVEEFEQIIDYYLDEFLYDQAAEAARLGSVQHPASVEIKYKVVHVYLEQGMGKQALEMLEYIPTWEHSNSEFYYLKGTAQCLSGKIHDAERSFDKGLSISTEDNFEALLNIAIAFENARQYRHAIKYLEMAHEISPEYLSVIYDLGYFNERIDKYKKSVEYYQEYLDQDPFSENVWYNLGVAYFQLELPYKALEAYEYSLALNPDYASAYFNKANTYSGLGLYEKAIETISEFLEIEPDNEHALIFLGDTYEQTNQYSKALTIYKKVIELDNTDSEGWFGAGMVHYQLNNYDEATIYLLKALEFDNQNTDYWINLGYVYEESDRKEEAVKCFRQVVKIDKTDHEGWLLLSGVLLNLDALDDALIVLRLAITEFPENEMLAIKMAECQYKLDNFRPGLKFLAQALAVDADLLPDFLEKMGKKVLDKPTLDLIRKYKV